MANSKQARKRVIQAEKNRENNKWQVSRARTWLKKVTEAIAAQQKDVAQEAYKTAISLIDKLANKGNIHKNKAARHKSRLSKQIKEIA